MATPRVGKPSGDPTPDRFRIFQPTHDSAWPDWWGIWDSTYDEMVVYCRHRYDALLLQDVLETATGRPERLGD